MNTQTVSRIIDRNAPEGVVREYLRLVANLHDGPPPPGFAYRSIAHWLLAHGRFWPVAPCPVRPMPAQQCYQNAYRLAARSRGRYRYVEGIALSIIPTDHAWCVDAQDRVVDPTWPDGVAYFGAVFALDAVRAVRRETGMGSLLQDYRRRFPLLRGPK